MPQIDRENLIDKLDETGMLYFVIVSLFSAETLVDVESCEVSQKGVEMLRAELPTSKYKDDPKIKKFLDNAERIIKRDLEEFKKEQQDKQSQVLNKKNQNNENPIHE